MKKAIFLDRDGVINVDKSYVYKIEDFEFCDGVFEALSYFQKLGYLLIIATNQSGIARGYYGEEDFLILSQWMKREFLKRGIVISAIYHCPHMPEQNCECRKPKSGMFLQAIADFDIDVSHSWMIGDKQSDIDASMGAGVKNNILLGKSNVNFILDTINLIKE
ncbi:MAG: D-glycero-beta-D-manno-heptose 1,7-bisphosphate 7-phosphatase [Sulfurospirillaceae bacterium]|nr:D-glycero-beta-D-manno-heptose 1,7-bisphosphate 7-phosphatase [Sulfurospirillaceae bacterium]